MHHGAGFGHWDPTWQSAQAIDSGAELIVESVRTGQSAGKVMVAESGGGLCLTLSACLAGRMAYERIRDEGSGLLGRTFWRVRRECVCGGSG
jgi:hypothetical protein